MNEFSTTWAMALLRGISDNCSAKELDACLKHCAECHYEACGRGEMAAQFAGDLAGFVHFLEEKFGIAIQVDYEAGKILYDVNQNCCICPMAEGYDGELPKSLCECSHFFTERMFSEVLQRPAHTKLLRSWLRDKKSCLYEITI